jgi:hypothetical protein
MPTLTGYEPNNLVGKGPGNVPMPTSSSRTFQTPQQIVPADTLGTDLSDLIDASMSSLLDEIFDEPIAPTPAQQQQQQQQQQQMRPAKAVASSSDSGTIMDEPKDVGHHGSSTSFSAPISNECPTKVVAKSSNTPQCPAKAVAGSSEIGQPKDDGHHGLAKRHIRFSDEIAEPKDDGHHGSAAKHDKISNENDMCPAKAEATRNVQSTSQSSSSPAKAVAPSGYSSTSNDAIVAADLLLNLELENANLRKALEAKDLELYETKVHAENYAHQALQDSRSKAEQALAFQKVIFESAHEEYSTVVRDICETEVAQSTANLEAIANSVIGGQQQELQTASIIVANLQQHLSHAQQVAAQESQDELLVEAKAKAQVDAQKVASAQQLSSLRVSLETDAEASHSKILNAREEKIRSEAEELHTASMQQEQQTIDKFQSQLQQATLDIQKLDSDLVTSISNYSDSEGHLAQVQTELRKTQESLVFL